MPLHMTQEFFKFDGDLCLVMAHCEGGDLFAHAKALRKAGKAVEEDKAWQWLVQLLLALSYCHSKKILHRDVKTQNVFLTRDGRALLGDFGLAKQLQRTLEMARTPIGTPYYMWVCHHGQQFANSGTHLTHMVPSMGPDTDQIDIAPVRPQGSRDL